MLGALLWSRGNSSAPYEMGGEKNGYDLFLKAALVMEEASALAQTNDTRESIAEKLAANREALALVREGLKLRVEAPESAYDVQTMGLSKLNAMEGLGRALEFEGQEAERNGKHAEAANTYLELIRFGQKVETGPMNHLLAGRRIARVGVGGLERLEPSLSGPERTRVARELRALEGSRMEMREIVRRLRFYSRRNVPTLIHYAYALYMTRSLISSVQLTHEQDGESMTRLAEKLER